MKMLLLSARNIPGVTVVTADGINVLDVVTRQIDFDERQLSKK